MPNELVFLEPNSIEEEPFTTSEVIALNTNNKHHAVRVLIQKYENDLNEFGKLSFEMRPLPSGQSEKIYHLNEPQSTLLITFMRNNDIVVKFKKSLVKQFYVMYKELNKRTATRQRAKMSRECLTNAIQGLPESPHKAMKYKHYTDLVYKIVFGKNASQLKNQYGIDKKDSVRNYFTAEEMEKVEKLEQQISSLVELGLDYKAIKSTIEQKYLLTA